MTIDSVSRPIVDIKSDLEYGYGEKEKQEEAINEVILNKTNKFERLKTLYENKIGTIDSNINQWLSEICEVIDVSLFERDLDR